MPILITKYKTGIDFPPLRSGLTHVEGENTLTFPYKSGDDQTTFSTRPGVHLMLINGGALTLTDDTDTFTVAFGASDIVITWHSQRNSLRDIDDVVVVFNAFAKPTEGMTRLRFTATSGQTVFSGNDVDGTALQFRQGGVLVFQNDNYLETTDYNTNTANTVELNTGATAGDKISIIAFDSVTDNTAVNNAVTNKLPLTGGTMVGNIDLDGNELILDTDGDTSIQVTTDDIIDFKVGGVDQLEVTSGFLRPKSGGGVHLGSSVRRFQSVNAVSGNLIGQLTLGVADGTEPMVVTSTTKVENLNADLLDGQEGSYYTDYTNTAIANLVDSAPGTLDTLNELAAALNDDANFSTTITNSIATKLPLTGGTMSGAITFAAGQTFDGRDVSALGDKLDNIEANADVTDTANVVAALTAGTNISISAAGEISSSAALTDADIKTQYENNSNTNAFTDNLLSKLNNIEDNADVTDTANVVAALTAGTNISISAAGEIASSASLTDSEIKTQYENNSDTNAFTDTLLSKLNNIEDNADVTDATNVSNAGAAMLTGASFLGDVNFAGDNYNLGWDKSANALEFGDSAEATFGASADLKISHQSAWPYSQISNINSNGLLIRSDTTKIQNNTTEANTEDMAVFNNGGSVELYHNGSKKFETTSAGTTVTGNISVTGTVDGRDLQTDGGKLDLIENNADVTDATNVANAGALMTGGGTMTGNINFAATQGFDAGQLTSGTVSNDRLSLAQQLQDIVGLSPTDGSFIVGDGTNFVLESGNTARTSLGLGSAATANTTDFATSSQGTKADNALPKAGGEMSGDLKLRGNELFLDSSDTMGLNDSGGGSLRFKIGGSNELNLSSAILQPEVDKGLSLGSVNKAFSSLHVGQIHTDSAITIGGAIATLSFQKTPTAQKLILASPNVTGVSDKTITFPDATGTVALTSDVDTAISNLVDSSPAALDTLNELAAALNNDAAFSTTVTNSIADKMPLSGGTFTNSVTFSGNSGNLAWSKQLSQLGFGSTKAVFGSSALNGLQILHNTNALIVTGGGDLILATNDDDKDVRLRADDGSGGLADYFQAKGSTGEVILSHYGSEKFKTTANGAEITGTLNGHTIPTGTGTIALTSDITGGGTIASQNANNVDIDGGAIDGVTIGTNDPVDELQVDNLNFNASTIKTLGSGQTITIEPGGGGRVDLKTHLTMVGDLDTDAAITTRGTGDLTLNTNQGVNSGSITIADGANGNISLTPNGTGSVVLDGLSYPQSDGSNGHVLTTDGSGTLSFQPTSSSSIAANDIATGSAAVDIATTSGQIVIDNQAQDQDILFKINDGGTTKTPLLIDASANDVKLQGAADLIVLDGRIDLHGNVTGTDDETQIFKSGNITSIAATGSGHGIEIKTSFNQKAIKIEDAGKVELFYANNSKFETTSAGVSVTGTLNGHTIPGGAGTLALTSGIPTVGTIASQDANNVDIDGGSIDGVAIGANSVATDLRVGGFRLTNNNIFGTVTNQDIVVTPNGTGDVALIADTVKIGDLNANATITTRGTGDLTLSTNGGTQSGTIVIQDGIDNNIVLTPAGTGTVQTGNLEFTTSQIKGTVPGNNIVIEPAGTGLISLTSDGIRLGNTNSDVTVSTAGAGKLLLAPSATFGASIELESGSNSSINLSPGGSGNVTIDGLTYPDTDGSNGHVLTTNGSGTLSFQPASGTSGTTPAHNITTGNTAVEIATTSGSITLDAQGSDQDIIFKGTDNNTDITALTLDMSNKGKAIFHGDGLFRGGTISVTNNNADQTHGSAEIQLYCQTNAHALILKAPDHFDFPNSNDQTLTLPPVTGTVLSDKNVDAGAIVSSGVDHVLVSVGGELKRITTANLGIGSGGGSSYSDTDVDTHLNLSSASANEVLSYNGSDYEWVAQSSGGGGGSGITTGKAIAMAMVFG